VQPVGRPHRLHQPLSQVTCCMRLCASAPQPSDLPPSLLSPPPPPLQLQRPSSLRPDAPPPPLPPYAWPTSTAHPLDKRSSSNPPPTPPPPPPPPAAAAAVVSKSHSEMHMGAHDDDACYRLHRHGGCFESGKAPMSHWWQHVTPSQPPRVTCHPFTTPPHLTRVAPCRWSAAVAWGARLLAGRQLALELRSSKGDDDGACVQQRQQRAAADVTCDCNRKCDMWPRAQAVDARAHHVTQRHKAAAAAVAGLNVSCGACGCGGCCCVTRCCMCGLQRLRASSRSWSEGRRGLRNHKR